MFFDPYDPIFQDDGQALANLPLCKRCGQTALHSNHFRQKTVVDRGTTLFGLLSCNVERRVPNPSYHPFDSPVEA